MTRISVLMGVYNCADTLGEAIDSILYQTCTEWKLIICDDGSTDTTASVVLEYTKKYPEKIVFIQNEKNMGLNHTLNCCLSLADTEYCARMDGDDISHPERLERELAFLDSHPEFAIVSTGMEYFDEKGVWGRSLSPEHPEPLDFAKGSPFCHAPCMIRTSAYREVGGYTNEKRLLRVEDYHLWIKMYSNGFKGENLKEILYRMRDDRGATRRRKYKFRINEAYVRYLAVKELKLPKKYLIYVLRPLIIGLIPLPIYEYLHKKRLEKGAAK